MAIPNSYVIEVQYRAKLFGQRVIFLSHLRVAQTSTLTYIPELIALGNILTDVVTAGFPKDLLACQGSQVEYEELRLQQVSGIRLPYYSAPFIQNGTHADNCTTPNVAAVLNKRSQRPYRHQNSPSHIAGVPDTQYDLGELLTAYKTKVRQVGLDMVTPVNVTSGGGQYNWCTWDRVTNPIDASWDFWDYSCNPDLRVMRRRTVGLGE